MRINTRNYGYFSIIFSRTQLEKLAQADEDFIGELVGSALKKVKKLDEQSRESGEGK